MLDILVIAPHPDDAELGCGGAILRWKAEGKRVGILDLTSGEPTPHGSLEIRASETAAATEILQLDSRENLGLPNRSLEHTLEARAKLAGVIREQRPRWLLAPYWVDAHPRSRRRGGIDRGGAVLGEAYEDRLAWEAASSGTHFELLVRAPEGAAAAGVCARHHSFLEPMPGDRVLSESVRRGPASDYADVY